jgi:hypothetical protein
MEREKRQPKPANEIMCKAVSRFIKHLVEKQGFNYSQLDL